MNKLASIAYSVKAELEYRKICSQAYKKCSYGDRNKDKKFRIVGNHCPAARAQGLTSTVFEVLPSIIDAREQGYIPVVDFYRSNRYQLMLQERELWKKENAWEYYFTQPEKGVSLEEVWQSKYVEKQIKRYSNRHRIGDGLIKSSDFRYLSLALRHNIHLQNEIKEKVRREKHRLFSQTNKILGVGIRAGYRRGILLNIPLYDNHPNIGSCKDYIDEIERKLNKWNYDSFFLSIDDRAYLEEIKKYFGKSCIYLERPRGHYFKDALLDIPCLPGDDEAMIEFTDISIRTRNEDYLIELYLLAQCDGLYASRGTGNNFAYLVNGGRYNHVKFTDLGEFHT